jgi:serine/threonine protein kinase
MLFVFSFEENSLLPNGGLVSALASSHLKLGFSTPEDQFTEEFRELYASRLKSIAGIGIFYVPLLFYLELAYWWLAAPDFRLSHAAVSRGLLTALCIGVFLYARRPQANVRWLTVFDYAMFGGVCFVSNHLGLLAMGIDSPYFCGTIMMGYVRAFFLPGGLRRVVPMLILLWLLFPLSFLALAPLYPEVHAQLADSSRMGLAVLEFLLILACLGLASLCAWVVDLLQHQAFRLKRIGRYHMERKLGEGGMGVVYLAQHGTLKRPTAIKLLGKQGSATSEMRTRFEREARHTASLSHPNTIQIFDFGVSDAGTLYYAMEFVEGMDLARLVDRFGPVSPARAIHFLRQAARSLAHAHAAGIIHRDVKPANCMIYGPNGEPDFLKVLDFGLAKLVGAAQQEESLDERLSRIQTVVGTPAYMSPEACLGHNVDARSDLYSLGCVAYYLLTGRPIFQGDSWMQVMMQHASSRPPPIHQLNPTVPNDLTAVIDRCLEKRPEDRYANATELDEALAACADAGKWGLADAARWWDSSPQQVDDATTAAEIVNMNVGTTLHAPLPDKTPQVSFSASDTLVARPSADELLALRSRNGEPEP